MMAEVVNSTNQWAALYFVVLISLGNYILVNLFVAIMVDGFAADIDAINAFKEAILKARAVMGTISLTSGALDAQKAAEQAAMDATAIKVVDEGSKSKLGWHRWLPPFCCFNMCCETCGRRSLRRVGILGLPPAPPTSTRLDRLRDSLAELLQSRLFSWTMGFCVLMSIVTLSMERPSIDSAGFERTFLDYTSNILAVVFLAEMILKMMVFGIVEAPHGYLRNGWHRFDGFLAVVGIVDLALASMGVRGTARKVSQALRMVRALRPFRMVQRVRPLRATVETLMLSIRPLSSVSLVGLVIFFIFAVMGTQLFRGIMGFCDGVQMLSETTTILTRSDCLSVNGTWNTRRFNFDNVGQSLLTLFVVSSKNGWVDILQTTIEARGRDLTPESGHNRWVFVYFFAFVLAVGFFVLNMFVGVIVENFQLTMPANEDFSVERHDSNTAEHLPVTDERLPTQHGDSKVARGSWKSLRGSEEIQSSCSQIKLQVPTPPRWYSRRWWSVLARSRYLEVFVTVAICVHFTMLCTEHYNQPAWLGTLLWIQERFFAAFFFCELLVKLVGLGIRAYIQSRWHRLDAVLVLTSLIALMVEGLSGGPGTESVVLKLLRLLRLARIFKILRATDGVMALLSTVVRGYYGLLSSKYAN
jgi:voltage-dependent calcium channel T type alpha-1H